MKHLLLRRRESALVALAFFLACTRGDAPRLDSASAGGSRQGGVSGRLPGTLTKPVGEYTANEFFDLVSHLEYTGGHERARKCRKDAACEGSKRTKVFIDAIATQDSIGPTTTPPFGVVYARVLNRGDAEEARYRLAPGKQFEYYMIITPSSGGGMAWQLQQLDNTKGARRLTRIGSGTFLGCHHTWVRGASADFKTCAQAAAAHDSTHRLALTPSLDEDPIWIACDEGCCYGAT